MQGIILKQSNIMLIHASEIAACIGKNPYQSRKDMLSTIFKRTFQSKYEAQSTIVTKEDTVAALISTKTKSDPAVKNAIETIIKSDANACAATVLEVVAQSAVILKASVLLTPHELDIIQEHCKSTAFKSHGTVKEETSMRKLGDLFGTLVKNNSYEKRRIPKAPFALFIGGRNDGIASALESDEDQRDILVEIKNRMRRLFNKVVDYEKVQIMSYMYIFEMERAKLVERFGEEVAVHDVLFDDGMWMEVEAGLIKFATEVRDMAK